MTRKLLVFFCVAGLLAGQDPPATQSPKKDSDAIKVTFKFVGVPVSVTDRNGVTVDGLLPLDFRLFDNGKLQNITEDVASHPISLVVVIQANSEVEKILPQIQRLGALLEAQVLGETGEVAVLAFDHQIKQLTGFTSEPGKVGEALKKLKPGSWTACLNDATMEGVNLLRNRPVTRKRVMLIISENRDKGSQIGAREVLSAIEFAAVQVYSVNMSQILGKMSSQALPPRPNPIPPEGRPITNGVIDTHTTDSQMNTGNWIPIFTELFAAAKMVFVPEPLKVYTSYTGGRSYSFMSQKTLDKAVTDIGAELHSQYLLVYSPNNQDEAGFHHIIVQVTRAGLNVRARDGYYLAGAAQ